MVGRNGAGKSTLLRLLTGISLPTEGEIDVFHRMSAILELGSGFHPEFSGRENVFLGGAVLGMEEEEIRRKYQSIVDFAELGPFMELPFKTYSLGMQARLSFAVAISVDPEILIIDEALAAGDSAFIAKCFERIRRSAPARPRCSSSPTTPTWCSASAGGRCGWRGAPSRGRRPGPGLPGLRGRALRVYEAAEREAVARRRFPGRGGARAGRRRRSKRPARRGRVWGTGGGALRAGGGPRPGRGPAGLVYSGEPLTVRIAYEGEAPGPDLALVVQIARADGVVACSLDAREAGLSLEGRGTGGQGVGGDARPAPAGGGGGTLRLPHLYRDRSGGAGAGGRDPPTTTGCTPSRWSGEGRPYDVAVEQPARWRHIPSVLQAPPRWGFRTLPHVVQCAPRGGRVTACEQTEIWRPEESRTMRMRRNGWRRVVAIMAVAGALAIRLSPGRSCSPRRRRRHCRRRGRRWHARRGPCRRADPGRHHGA